jgi:mannose-6-phosphate isomerase-like protein (cupin superfamily)
VAEMVEKILHDDVLYAIIVRDDFREDGIHFFTTNDLSQQLAFMKHRKGKTIDPHIHLPVKREVHRTQEVLVIKSGQLRVDFYSEAQEYLESRTLAGGDVVLLIAGGHGFEVLDDLEMFEIKQGPYSGDQDKQRFTVNERSIRSGE